MHFKSPRAKNQLDTFLLVEMDLNIFKRGLESRQKVQLELLNENFGNKLESFEIYVHLQNLMKN